MKLLMLLFELLRNVQRQTEQAGAVWLLSARHESQDGGLRPDKAYVGCMFNTAVVGTTLG